MLRDYSCCGIIWKSYRLSQFSKATRSSCGWPMVSSGAISFFLDSQTFCGEHHVSWYNMGICYNYIGRLQEALQCFNSSLLLRPEYHDARGWKARIESRIGMASLQSVGANEALRAPTAVGAASIFF